RQAAYLDRSPSPRRGRAGDRRAHRAGRHGTVPTPSAAAHGRDPGARPPRRAAPLARAPRSFRARRRWAKQAPDERGTRQVEEGARHDQRSVAAPHREVADDQREEHAAEIANTASEAARARDRARREEVGRQGEKRRGERLVRERTDAEESDRLARRRRLADE